MNKRLLSNRWFLFAQKAISLVLLCSFAFGDFGTLFNLPSVVPQAEAAVVTMDPNIQTVGASHIHGTGQSVFVTDQIGYKFFRDAGGYCVYRKTSNGGTTWGATTTVDAQIDCIGIAVWYDKWTPNATGTMIHIVTIDTSASDPWYNRLDTSNDTLLLGSAPVSVVTGSGQGGTFTALSNYPAITKGTDGTIYIAISDNTDSFIVECTVTCQTNTQWTETGTNPLPLTPDFNLLEPLPGGNIMLINRLIATNVIRYKIWNNTTWSAAWTTIDAVATGNVAYPIGMAAVESTSTPGHIYLAYIANNATLGTDDEVRSHYFNGTSWATTTKVITGTARGLTNVAIALDASNDNVYVAYTGRTTAATAATGNVYWNISKDNMTTWGTERGPVNTAATDIYGVDLTTVSDQRIFVSWDNKTANTLLGDTIADIFPGIHATTTGTQTVNVNASTSAFYVGGKFALYNNYNKKNKTVTGITITENGTIDASVNLSNIKLKYEMDTTAPYDCASESYAGTEAQFGSTTANFNGPNGTASFTGSVTISTTSTMCIYPIVNVLNSTPNNATIDLTINNPATDITVTGDTAGPSGVVQPISGATTVLNDNLTQSRFHWRADNGTEVTATAKTAAEGVSFIGYQRGTPIRLRMEVSNSGGSTSASYAYRLENARATSTCYAGLSWVDVGAVGGDFDMFNSANITDGNNTTDIAVATGGVTNDNTTFLVANGGVKDTSSQTGAFTLSSTQFAELEYSIVASTSVKYDTNSCFRLTRSGVPLDTYSLYPSLKVYADVNVTASGTQATTLGAPLTNQYLGGKFVFIGNTVAKTISSVKLKETGTVNAQTGIGNIRLKYDLDTTAPYNCVSESYAGNEPQFGATSTAFSGPNGTTTISGSLSIATTSAVCMYVVLDTKSVVSDGETIDVEITNPSTDVILASGSVSSTTVQAINGSTAVQIAVPTQTRYQWRGYNGTQATSTSLTNGTENAPISDIDQSTPVRVRLEVANKGSVTTGNTALRLEYGTKSGSCSAVSVWTDVGAVGGAFDMFDSIHLTDGANTTNIATNIGGLTDDNPTFKISNAGVKDTSSQVATTTLLTTEFTESEFSIKQTTSAAFNTTYCFRLSNAGTALRAYTTYPELTTSPDRDFKVQRGTANFSATSFLLRAGVDYIAPSASTSAFVRITNSNYTGAGDSSAGGVQNAKDVTAYISNPSNLLTSFTITRPAAAIATTTRVSWEIVEFIGAAGSDNEIKVRSQGALTYGATSLTATGTATIGIVNDNNVAVFITGQLNPDTTTTKYNTGQSVSSWLSATHQPAFQRGEASSVASAVSYAVVEFTGINWKVQRASHTYAAVGVTETTSITAVNSLSRTFLHTQTLSGTALNSEANYGHEVWLSSIGAVSFALEAGATSASLHTSVAWIIENTQTNGGAMTVTRTNGNSTGGANPVTLSLANGITLVSVNDSSIFGNTRSAGAGTNYPRPIVGLTIASTTNYEIWRSDTGSLVTYRAEVVEWPTAGLTFIQKDYRFYVDNSVLTPTDPWPVGVTDLGENTTLTAADQPLGNGEVIRVRMNLTVRNATMPALSSSFKLQYGVRVTSCTAIVSWTDIGNATSSAIWRGHDATSTADGAALSIDPPTGGDLKLTFSNTAGTYEEANNTAVNPYQVNEDNHIEYDWDIQQNGANTDTFYCLRMVDSSGSPLQSYTNYPQLRTSNFTPKTQNWRWYNDVGNETPISALASENTAPIDIGNSSTTKLRITVKETKNIAQNNTRFKLQYSEYPNFSNNVFDVIATSTCTASSTWCYYNGAGTDNAVISTKVLSDADSCVASVGSGCGTHTEGSQALSGFTQTASAATEYEFTLQARALRANAVYYFRLFDLVQNIPVVFNTSKTYPSIVARGASLVFAVSGVTAGTVTEGVTLDVTSTPTSIPFGTLGFGATTSGAYRLNVNTNATEGYQVLMFADQQLINSYGSSIPPVTGSNASPSSWSTGCVGSASGCFGYHVGDDSLQGGSARFGANDSYASLSTTTAQEVMYSSIPANDTSDIVYKVKVTPKQPSGNYATTINFIAVPIN